MRNQKTLGIFVLIALLFSFADSRINRAWGNDENRSSDEWPAIEAETLNSIRSLGFEQSTCFVELYQTQMLYGPAPDSAKAPHSGDQLFLDLTTKSPARLIDLFNNSMVSGVRGRVYWPYAITEKVDTNHYKVNMSGSQLDIELIVDKALVKVVFTNPNGDTTKKTIFVCK